MRCFPGDRAMIVKSEAGHEGKLVDVLRPAEYGDCWHGYPEHLHLWWVRSLGSMLTNNLGIARQEFNFPDAYLRAFQPIDLLGGV